MLVCIQIVHFFYFMAQVVDFSFGIMIWAFLDVSRWKLLKHPVLLILHSEKNRINSINLFAERMYNQVDVLIKDLK